MPLHRLIRLGTTLAACVAITTSAIALTVTPPSFDELVVEADSIIRGTVTRVEARKVTNAAGHNVIKTFVTFRVATVIKGADASEVTLAFLGGKVGGESLSIPGMPQFAEGDEEYVFVTGNGKTICPLVGAAHGSYPIKRASDGAEQVMRRDGLPLQSTAEVGRPLHQAAFPALLASRGRGLAPAQFESSLRAAVSQLPNLNQAR